MKKLILSAIVLTCLLLTQPLFATTGQDVVPINWSKFTFSAPTDTLSLKIRGLLQNEVKYLFSHYLDSISTNVNGLYELPEDPGGENKIRIASQFACAISALLATGTYDSAITGVSETDARIALSKIIRTVANSNSYSIRYYGNNGLWGYGWQDNLWASYAGFAAWLSWEHLDDTLKTMVAKMVEGEANRFNYEPPSSYEGSDTKAEENAWMSTSLTLAVAMLPNHIKMQEWKLQASQWMASAFMRRSDLARNTLIDGRLPSQWIGGWNMIEPGYVYNHGIVHPDYMTTIGLNLYSVLWQSLSGKIAPQSAMFNFDVIYKCFVDYKFTTPEYRAPGGTIYQPGKANFYYPQGNDWSMYRMDDHLENDIFAMMFPSVGEAASIPAATWAKIRADTLSWMQSRFTTGQVYGPGEWDAGGQSPWIFAEVQGAWYYATTYLMLWLKNQNAISPVGNWFLDQPDSVSPAAPSITATPLDPTRVQISWPSVTDNGSGVSYYRIYRDSTEVGFTKESEWVDMTANANSTYHYSVTALDWNNNESERSELVTVTTPQGNVPTLSLQRVQTSNRTHIQLLFNQPVDSLTAINTSNYSISDLSVQSVKLNNLRDMVILTVSPMDLNTTYSLTITNLLEVQNSFTFTSLNDSLVGYWPMNESFGTVIHDLSDSAANGISWHPTSTNAALQFISGSDTIPPMADRIFMGDGLNALDTPFTVALWVKVTNNNLDQYLLCTNHSCQGKTDRGAVIIIKKTGQVAVTIGGGGWWDRFGPSSKITTSSITYDSWFHIAACVKNDSSMSIYINGTEMDGVTTKTAYTKMGHYIKSFFTIGYDIDFPRNSFSGDMKELRVYRKLLSVSDIVLLAADSLQTTTDNQVVVVKPLTITSAPNPFNPASLLAVSIPSAASVKLTVHDIAGKIVKELYKGNLSAGNHSFRWDATNSKGVKVATGVYVYKLNANNKILNCKTILTK